MEEQQHPEDRQQGAWEDYRNLCEHRDALQSQLTAAEAEIVRLRKAALAYRDLCACYRVGKRPSEELFERIMLGKQALEASDG